MTGERVEVEVTGIAHGGISVARLDGRVIFVADAIPGERVVAEITDDRKKSFWRADTVEVLAASPHRRAHVWAEASIDRAPADRAGGAEFGHIDLAHQRELKRQVLVDAMARFGGTHVDVTVEPVPSGTAGAPQVDDAAADVEGTGWRTRTRLHVAADGTVGPFAARSHRVIPVSSLPLTVPEAARVLDIRVPRRGADHVDIVVPSIGDPFVLTDAGAPHPAEIVERVGGRDFRLDAGGFWQVHRHAASVLTRGVQDAIDPALFDPAAANLDLYGGVGLLAAAVSDRFGRGTRIESVESERRATGHARRNLADWPQASASADRVDRYLARHGEARRRRSATVVLDPPRSGAGAAVVASITRSAPAQIVYVACDPVALARDVGSFAAAGYRVGRVRAFDLFPNTHHLEAIATLLPA